MGAITNPIGSILSGILAEYFGRKLSIQISSAPVIVGCLLIAFSKNIWMIYAGRLITGIAGGNVNKIIISLISLNCSTKA